MTLSNFLPTIAHNPKLYLKIIDSDGSQIINFDAASYEALNDNISSREVDKITIAEERDIIKIFLKEIPEPTPGPDDTNVPLDPDQLGGSVLNP